MAFVLTLAIQLPQAVKVAKTKHTKDLSLGTYLILCLASSCWIIYGLLRGDLAAWAANVFGLLLAIYILYYKVRLG